MPSRKPHLAVFFGGQAHSHDLSQETGYWVCQYLPRSQYNITPVRITPEGNWQVPLGTLPQSGPVDRMLEMLFKGLQAVTPSEGLQRLLRHPINAFMTTLRGVGGDDGSFHSLGSVLKIPVVGSQAATAQQTYNKHLCASRVDPIVSTPFTLYFRQNQSVDEIVEAIRNELVPPLFIKPAAHEGSSGVESVHSLDELTAAVNRTKNLAGDILAQERIVGTELNLTLIQDERGKIHTLPTTLILPKKTDFYDHLSKRRAGRVQLHTSAQEDNPIVAQAEAIARDVYEELGCQGYANFDFIHGDDVVDLLEVNTIPSLTSLSPLKQQLQVAGLHPSQFLTGLIQQTLQ